MQLAFPHARAGPLARAWAGRLDLGGPSQALAKAHSTQIRRKTRTRYLGLRYLFDTDMRLIMRQVILTPGEDGYWVAEVPSLPGCISQGKTREEALLNIKEAIDGYIAALKDDDIPVPEEHFEVLVAVV